jgi:hypothetical protein
LPLVYDQLLDRLVRKDGCSFIAARALVPGGGAWDVDQAGALLNELIFLVFGIVHKAFWINYQNTIDDLFDIY